jgi:hypothetical protein
MNSITALDPEPALSILDLSLIYLPIAWLSCDVITTQRPQKCD